ncbi:hypothetical protein IJ750_07715 [bacterium]|nr:hypothetical protein [bacterium]
MNFGVNCQEFFRSLLSDIKGETEVKLNTLSESLRKSASIFDVNKDKVLDSNELKTFLDGFYKADMSGKTTDGKLSDKEISTAYEKYDNRFKNVGLEEKKQLLLEVYSKVLAQQIKAQIDGASVNQRTLERLSKINSENVVDVLKEFNRLSPSETLASAIDNEWGLDIETVKKYICRPLAERAKQVGANVGSYANIKDINGINNYINKSIKSISTPNTASTANNRTVHVIKKDANGVNVDFTYNRASIEDYVINRGVDSSGRALSYFSEIPNIRKKPANERTKTENNLLKEFENYISTVCKVGEEYGVDPKFIIAITQREVGFKGLNQTADGKNNPVTGGNGKGYMQITSVCVVDVMGGSGNTISSAKYTTDKNNIPKYGKEMRDLLKSHGFNPDCSKNLKAGEAQKIWEYIKSNKDPEFNIRFGTLMLRYQLKKSNGDMRIAAQNYNGHPKHKINYGKAVKSFYDKLTLTQNEFKA